MKERNCKNKVNNNNKAENNKQIHSNHDIDDEEDEESARFTIDRATKINGFSQPFSLLQILSWVILVLESLWVFFILGDFISTDKAVYIIYLILHSLSFGLLFIFGFFACYTDPSDPLVIMQKQGQELAECQRTHLCKVCKVFVGSKTKHCGICNKCVSDFDHHCQWLNNCVGKANYKFFIAFVLCIFLGLLINLSFTAYSLNLRNTDYANYKLRTQNNAISKYSSDIFLGLSVTALVFNIIAGIFTAELLIYHIWLRYTGRTTYEHIIERRKRADVNREKQRLKKLLTEKKKINAADSLRIIAEKMNKNGKQSEIVADDLEDQENEDHQQDHEKKQQLKQQEIIPEGQLLPKITVTRGKKNTQLETLTIPNLPPINQADKNIATNRNIDSSFEAEQLFEKQNLSQCSSRQPRQNNNNNDNNNNKQNKHTSSQNNNQKNIKQDKHNFHRGNSNNNLDTELDNESQNPSEDKQTVPLSDRSKENKVPNDPNSSNISIDVQDDYGMNEISPQGEKEQVKSSMIRDARRSLNTQTIIIEQNKLLQKQQLLAEKEKKSTVTVEGNNKQNPSTLLSTTQVSGNKKYKGQSKSSNKIMPIRVHLEERPLGDINRDNSNTTEELQQHNQKDQTLPLNHQKYNKTQLFF